MNAPKITISVRSAVSISQEVIDVFVLGDTSWLPTKFTAEVSTSSSSEDHAMYSFFSALNLFHERPILFFLYHNRFQVKSLIHDATFY